MTWPTQTHNHPWPEPDCPDCRPHHPRGATTMTDARADALTAPTADPGIVAALVYVGDQIAAMGTGSDRNRPRNAEQATGEGLGADAAERRTGPHRPAPAQHPTDRHLLPKEDR